MISAVIRDIVIILVGVTNLALFILLILLVWQIWQLIKLIRTEIRPIINDTQETVGTVRGTADFMTSNMVEPVVSTSSRFAGFRRSMRVMQDEIKGSMERVRQSESPPVRRKPVPRKPDTTPVSPVDPQP